MGKKTIKRVKNLMCLALGLALFFSTTIFICSNFYNNKIAQQINTTSYLKDYYLGIWGQQPNSDKSILNQTFTPYSLSIDSDESIISEKANTNITYNYNFNYKNLSLNQGNSGDLQYLYKWQLTNPLSAQPELKVNSLNLGAEKIFNNQYYATPVRKFTLMFDLMVKNLKQSFLPTFYSRYLFQYLFKNLQLIRDTIFIPLKIEKVLQNSIIDDEQFGWNKPQGLSRWIKASSHLKQPINKQYQNIQAHFSINDQLMNKLVGQSSSIYHLMEALNGTIKYKLWSKQYMFQCKGYYCSDDELVISQIANGFLTSLPLFATLNLNSTIFNLNNTFFNEIQYSQFCRNSPQITCMDSQSKIGFFMNQYFKKFAIVNFLMENKDKYDYIQQILELANGTAQSVVKYMQYIENKVFRYEIDDKFSYIAHQYTNQAINNLQKLLVIQLYSRIFTKHAENIKCQDYYSGQFEPYKSACNDNKLNFGSLDSIKLYMEGYFQYSRDYLLSNSGMSYQKLKQFFREGLFGQQIQEIKKILVDQFKCKSCDSHQLLAIQWGSGKILTNLPAQYFNTSIISILEWDQQRALKENEPQYYILMNQKLELSQAQQFLSYSNKVSFRNIFNLIRMNSQDDQSNKALKYVSKCMLGQMGGVFQVKQANELFSGYQNSEVILRKNMQIESGGIPWISETTSLIKLSNQLQLNYADDIDIFDSINTGIYDSSKLRNVNKVFGSIYSSSVYVSYINTMTSEQIFNRMETNKLVNASNIFGFHPYLTANDKLSVYLPLCHCVLKLDYVSESQYKDINVHVYKIENTSKIPIGIEEQNTNFVQITKLQLNVDPLTGLTISFNIVYIVSSKPVYFKYMYPKININIYEGTYYYQKTMLETVKLVQNDYQIMKIMEFVGILLAGGMILCLFILTWVYWKLKRQNYKKNSLLQSLEKDQQAEGYIAS